MPRTVARLLAESLEAHDIDLLYCVPGESYLGLTDALADMNRVRLIVCRHESGAAFMAVADGRMRDRAGVCVVSRGPGLSNAMVAIHSAYHDATPLVVLVGQVERKDFGRLALQEQNYSRLLADVTKGVIEVNEPVMASEALARAFHLAESGTRGPVAVILPEDLFEEPADFPVDPPRARARSPVRGPRTWNVWRRCWTRRSGRWCGWAPGCWATASAAIWRSSRSNGRCRFRRRIAGRIISPAIIRTTAAMSAFACPTR